jgi:voltage-gated potassium channel
MPSSYEKIINITNALLLLTIIIIAGSLILGYVEGMELGESFYGTVLLLATVTPFPAVTLAGRLISLTLLILGLGIVLYFVMGIGSFIVEGGIREAIPRLRGRFAKMPKMKGHFIICGYSDIGRHVAETFEEEKKKYVIVENNPEISDKLIAEGKRVINGNAQDPDVLIKAGAQRAAGVVATLGSNADNMYLILTAKEINPDLIIAAKATNEDAVRHLRMAGARIVILPDIVGGRRIAKSVIKAHEKIKEAIK